VLYFNHHGARLLLSRLLLSLICNSLFLQSK
jgi:hypothetical protein